MQYTQLNTVPISFFAYGCLLCAILGGCAYSGVPSSDSGTGASVNIAQWAHFSDSHFPISFDYPSVGRVQIENRGTVDSDIKITVFGAERGSTDFYMDITWDPTQDGYSLPKGTDIEDWVKRHPAFNEGEIAASRVIAGVSAAHRKVPSDVFFVPIDDRVYRVSVHDLSDPAVAPIENRMLDSIRID